MLPPPQRLVSLLEMLELRARRLFTIVSQVERVDAMMGIWKQADYKCPNMDSNLSVSVRNKMAKNYGLIVEAADTLGVPITKLAAQRVAKRLKERKKPVTLRELELIGMEVKSRLMDELSAVKLYALPKGAASFYNPHGALFGPEVEARFPDAIDDISEAGKCFAVGRYTASTFHLMRAMESAVQIIAAALGITNVEREWGKLLSDIAAAIEPMPKGDDRDAWSAVHANLYHVKQAWRNGTMHPKRTYTEEEAREVFDAMKAFMRHLAGMLPS